MGLIWIELLVGKWAILRLIASTSFWPRCTSIMVMSKFHGLVSTCLYKLSCSACMSAAHFGISLFFRAKLKRIAWCINLFWKGPGANGHQKGSWLEPLVIYEISWWMVHSIFFTIPHIYFRQRQAARNWNPWGKLRVSNFNGGIKCAICSVRIN